jgi:hypothetical protein
MILGSGSRQVPGLFRCILHGGLEAALQKGKSHFFVDLEPLAELDFGTSNIALSGPR